MPGPDAASLRDARAVVVLGSPPARVGVEIASSPLGRAQGLMFRDRLPVDEGMLFVFEEPGLHTFWMRNTLVPLDLVFMNAAGCVVGVVEGAEPLSDEPLGVAAESQLVLEVAAGFVERHGIRPGTIAQLPRLPLKEPS